MNHNNPKDQAAEEMEQAVPAEESAESSVSEPVEESPKKKLVGVVTDCLKLNVRKAPSLDAEVAFVILCLTPVEIDLEQSTDTFFKVRTADNSEGFCMKKFIALPR